MNDYSPLSSIADGRLVRMEHKEQVLLTIVRPSKICNVSDNEP